MKLTLIKIIRVLVIISLYPQGAISADDALGKTILARGNITAERNSSRVLLKRLSPVFRQDILRSGVNARAQFRMMDNALINLKESSVLRLRKYELKSSDGRGSVVMELISGGLRTITGAIGKKNKKDYQLRTPSATIGIRGTMFELLITKEGMYVAAWKGDIDVRSYSGKCDITLGDHTKHRFALVDNVGVCKLLVNVPVVFREGYSSTAGTSLNQIRNSITPLLDNPQKLARFRSLTIGQGTINQGRTDTTSQSNPIITQENGVISSNTKVSDFSQNIGGYPVGWGRWNKYTISSKQGASTDIQSSLLWSTYKPTSADVIAKRTGSVSYTHNIDSLSKSSMGKVSNVAVRMDVDFNSGQVDHGTISAHVPEHTWVGVFDGQVTNGKLSLGLNGGALVNARTGATSNATGDISADFVGDNAQAITGGFNMVDEANSNNNIESLFLIEQK